MKTEMEKYDKLMLLLRKAKPKEVYSEEIEKAVLEMIRNKHRSGYLKPDFIEFLFAWVYIGWIRRSLIGASMILVLIFVVQQNTILKQIDYLNKQIIVKNYDPAEVIEQKLELYNLRGSSQSVMIPEEDLYQILDSLSTLKFKYEEVMNLLESDPELKKVVEEKLKRNIRAKFNM